MIYGVLKPTSKQECHMYRRLQLNEPTMAWFWLVNSFLGFICGRSALLGSQLVTNMGTDPCDSLQMSSKLKRAKTRPGFCLYLVCLWAVESWAYICDGHQLSTQASFTEICTTLNSYWGFKYHVSYILSRNTLKLTGITDKDDSCKWTVFWQPSSKVMAYSHL